jgi:hypothetical protein
MIRAFCNSSDVDVALDGEAVVPKILGLLQFLLANEIRETPGEPSLREGAQSGDPDGARVADLI